MINYGVEKSVFDDFLAKIVVEGKRAKNEILLIRCILVYAKVHPYFYYLLIKLIWFII